MTDSSSTEFRVNKLTNQVEMSLRKSATVRPAQVAAATYVAGQIVQGTVTRVEAYGAFVRLEGGNVSGLVHKSNVCLFFHLSFSVMLINHLLMCRSPMTRVLHGRKRFTVEIKSR
jgi:polyribonucleotide nucleotidyltransferase